MLVGRTVTVKKELLETYDSERCLGTREGRDFFPGNYRIKKFSIKNPAYNWEKINPDENIGSFLRTLYGKGISAD